MNNRRFPQIARIVAVAALIAAAPLSAGDQLNAETELPEAVSELVDALSGVERVEVLDEERYAVHRRIDVTGSRVKRDATMIVAADGTVVDWGRDAGFLRSYTLSELRTTGHADLAKALSDLDPSIQTRGGG